MSEASYTAWDDNLYEWPPPDGWYEASDGRWWPEGYGPPASSPVEAEAEVSRSIASAPAGADGEPGAAGDPLTAAAPNPAANGSGDETPFDPERTSLFPAGGFAVADPAPPGDHAPAEPRRRVYDELPPIDDVFGGIDPYSTIETPAERIRRRAGSDASEVDPSEVDPSEVDPSDVDPSEVGLADAGPVSDGSRAAETAGTWSLAAADPLTGPPMTDFGLLGANQGPAQEPGRGGGGGEDIRAGVFGLEPVLEDERSFDSAFERVAESLRGDRGDGPGAPGPSPAVPDGPGAPGPPPAVPDGSSNGRVPDGTGVSPEQGLSSGPDTSPGAGPSRRGGPSAGTPLARSEVPPLPSDPDATMVTESPYRVGPGTDDGATALIDVAALRRTPDGVGAAFDTGRTVMAGAGPPEVPSLEGRFELPESLGDYVGAPTLERSSGPRRWWPLVVIGIAVLATASSIAAFLLLRGDGAGSGTDTAADPNGQGAFANPYPVGTGVVVYYNDEATGEQRRWVIQVLEPVVDATATLVSGASAQAPADGEVLATARIRVAYQSGPEPGSVADLRFDAAGSVASALFDQSEARCSAVTDPIDAGTTLLALESVEGNVCWRIPASELESLKLAVGAGPAAGTVHLALG